MSCNQKFVPLRLLSKYL